MTTRADLTAESPLSSRLIAWMHERFPLENAVLFVVLYAAAVAFGRRRGRRP